MHGLLFHQVTGSAPCRAADAVWWRFVGSCFHPAELRAVQHPKRAGHLLEGLLAHLLLHPPWHQYAVLPVGVRYFLSTGPPYEHSAACSGRILHQGEDSTACSNLAAAF